jgi:hypothetical protein
MCGIMSDYRDIQIIINMIGKDNIMTEEPVKMMSDIFHIAVSELTPIDEVMEEIKKRILSIEDVL